MATYQQQLEKLRLQKEAKAKAEAEAKARQLTPDQVAHWRLVMVNMGVPFAMSMPESIVQEFRDRIQLRLNAEFKQRDGDGESRG
jgi:hypothetical protein